MIERLPGFLLILGSVVTEGLGHIAFKRAADSGSQEHSILSILRIALKQYNLIVSGVICFIVEGLCWTFALKKLDVSLAYPIGSLELVVITLLCLILLKEKVTFRRWLGVALIVGGTLLVGAS